MTDINYVLESGPTYSYSTNIHSQSPIGCSQIFSSLTHSIEMLNEKMTEIAIIIGK
jgi:hypothetical protein